MSQSINTAFTSNSIELRSIDRLSASNDALTAETSSGVESDSYAGLGDQAYQAIDLEPQITAVSAWQSNLSTSQVKLQATQTALSSISAMASNLQTSLDGLTGTSSSASVEAVSQDAEQQLTQLTALLNTKSGNVYVFAGSASDQPPVTGNLASSAVVSAIRQSVASVGTNGATAVEADTLADASDNSTALTPFSSQLSTSPTQASQLAPSIQVGSGEFASNGVVATQGGQATATSTGSSIRHLILCLSRAAGLSGADQSSGEFNKLVADTGAQLQNVSQSLESLSGSVGEMQSDATQRSSNLSDLSTALSTQLGSIKDADIASVRTQQTTVQNQLSASYSLIADMKNMTLADYI